MTGLSWLADVLVRLVCCSADGRVGRLAAGPVGLPVDWSSG